MKTTCHIIVLLFLTQSVLAATTPAGDSDITYTSAGLKPLRYSEMSVSERRHHFATYSENVRHSRYDAFLNKAKGDFTGRGFLKDLLVYSTLSMATGLCRGESFAQSAENSLLPLFTPQFLLGQLGGCFIGCLAGSLIPIPGLGVFPIAFGTIVGGAVGHRFVDSWLQGNPSLGEAFEKLDYLTLFAQSVGGVLGAMVFAPIPIPAIAPIVGAIAGAKLAVWATRLLEQSVDSKLKSVEPQEIVSVLPLSVEAKTVKQGKEAAYLAFLQATGRGDRRATKAAYEKYCKSQ